MTTKQPEKKPTPFPTSENHGRPQEGEPKPVTGKPAEGAIDEGIEESFPASDPVSVKVTKIVKKPAGGGGGDETPSKPGSGRPAS